MIGFVKPISLILLEFITLKIPRPLGRLGFLFIMVTFDDCVQFITVLERHKHVKKILTTYHFNEIDLKTSKGVIIFRDDLISLTKDLISAGIYDEEIKVMIEILNGSHPLSGQPKDVSGDYVSFNAGWKIHLHVRPKNHKFVYYWLIQNCKYGWKYLSGGEGGKEFTIYIGSWDETEQFARILMQAIGSTLEEPIGDIVKDDIRVYEKIWARFDAKGRQDLNGMQIWFHQYGSHGLPYIESDMAKYMHNRNEILKNQRKYQAEFLERSYKLLNQKFGTYFRGSMNQVAKRIVWWINYLRDTSPGLPEF